MDAKGPNNAGKSIGGLDSVTVHGSTNYQPNQWDYNFLQTLTSNYTDEAYGSVAKELKEEVRLKFNITESRDQLKLIDSVQRLGIGYHFEKEVKGVLDDLLEKGYHRKVQEDGLHVTAVFFRLLRQNGFMISQDIFDYFKDDDGNFMASLSHDIKGLLSLYQASYLSFKGEKKLDAARAFAFMHLKTLCEAKPTLAREIAHVLELPSHWRPQRLEARRYMEMHEKEEDSILLQYAKLDFNFVQSTHQRELIKVVSWWMDLGLGNVMKFARDRTLECFFGVTIIVFQPQFGYCREWLPKIGNLLVVIDDVYDAYGSMDENELFTHVVDSWGTRELEKLPIYMKICFATICDLVDELAYNYKQHNGLDIQPHLQKVWKDLCKSFLVEAKWHQHNRIPTLSEYINNGWISSGGPLILLHTFFLMRHQPTKEAVSDLENCPKIVRLASIIFRLCNDLATSTAEQERGDTPTSIQCYMKESGVSETNARSFISMLISEAMKELNQECILCSFFPQSFIEACTNLARMALCLYQHRDGFSIPTNEIKDHIVSMLIKPTNFMGKGF